MSSSKSQTSPLISICLNPFDFWFCSTVLNLTVAFVVKTWLLYPQKWFPVPRKNARRKQLFLLTEFYLLIRHVDLPQGPLPICNILTLTASRVSECQVFLAENFSELNKIRVLVLRKKIMYYSCHIHPKSSHLLSFTKYFQILSWTFIISILLKSIYFWIEAKYLFKPHLCIMVIRIQMALAVTFFVSLLMAIFFDNIM